MDLAVPKKKTVFNEGVDEEPTLSCGELLLMTAGNSSVDYVLL